MSTDWIKMRVDLRSHPKVVRMSSALKADRLRVIGGLFSVWAVFDAHAVDGLLEGYTFDTLDEDLRWDGFSAAMAGIEWLLLRADVGGLEAPRFEEHNGKSAKRRAMEMERKRQERRPETVADQSGHLSASHADKKRTREEKRREEEYKEKARAIDVPGFSRECAHPRDPDPETGVNGTPTVSARSISKSNGSNESNGSEHPQRPAKSGAGEVFKTESMGGEPGQEKRQESPQIESVTPTAAGRACKAMKAKGLTQGLNPGDPRLIELIKQGATIAELEGLAMEAVAKGKGMQWLLVALASRRQEAANIVLAPIVEDPMAWRRRPESIVAMGESLGAPVQPGETITVYERRVLTAWQRRRARAGDDNRKEHAE